jgi:site-specific DNA-methyltransferase (adenine-specific)
MAAKALGWETVPVQWVDVTPEEELRILVVDNRTTRIGQDDTTKITDILAELANTPIGLEGTGYGAADLDALIDELAGMTEPAELLTDPDEVPEEVETRCKAGDLWILGRHRLLCGDCATTEDVTRLINGDSIDLLLTDPPYGINADRQHFEGHGWTLREKTEWDKERPRQETIQQTLSVTSEQIIWGGNYFTDYLTPSMGWLVWDKGQRDFSLADCELAWRSERKAARVFTYSRAKSNREQRHHPTQKPVALMTWCIELCDEPKTIYDPFLGSGTTLIASEQLGRKCYGMEISPKYCDVIIQRWENATGQKAVLDEG